MVQSILKKLHKIIFIHKLTVHNSLIEYNLYFAQLPLLRFVKDNPLCNQRDIAKHLCVSPPSVTNSIKRLEKNGYLSKKDDPENLRRSQISITEKGSNVLETAENKLHSIDNDLFRGFSKEELSQFNQLIDKMMNNLHTSKYSDESITHLINEFNMLNANNKENL